MDISTPQELIQVMTAFAGTFMIIGGVILVYVGAIKFHDAAKDSSLEIEIDNYIKINARNPGIAFFVIGLLFFMTALYFSTQSRPVFIQGQLQKPYSNATLSVERKFAEFNTDSNGFFSDQFLPDSNNYMIRISAPGYEDYTEVLPISSSSISEIYMNSPIVLTRERLKIVPFKLNPFLGLTKPTLNFEITDSLRPVDAN